MAGPRRPVGYPLIRVPCPLSPLTHHSLIAHYCSRPARGGKKLWKVRTIKPRDTSTTCRTKVSSLERLELNLSISKTRSYCPPEVSSKKYCSLGVFMFYTPISSTVTQTARPPPPPPPPRNPPITYICVVVSSPAFLLYDQSRCFARTWSFQKKIRTPPPHTHTFSF